MSTSTPSLSREQLQAIWAKAVRDDDYPTFAENFLWIQTKEDGLQPLRLWKHQQQMWQDRLDLMARGEFPWRLYLKYRQGGFSKYFVGETFFEAIRNQDYNALIIAYEKDLPTEFLDVIRVFLKEMPDWAKPTVVKDSASEIVFGGYPDFPLRSTIRIGTAKTHIGAGIKIGRTIQRLHITEAAEPVFINEKLVKVFQTVSKNCEVIMESTANGVGNYFYDTYWDATKGESKFHQYFVPWTVHEEYALPVPLNFQPDDRLAKKLGITDELQLMQDYGLTAEQLVWRRMKVKEFKKDIPFFKAQYPLTDTEAFLQSGSSYFHQPTLAFFLESPLFCKGWPTKRGSLSFVDDKWCFEENENGCLEIYRGPDPTKTYCLSADVADGLPTGDPLVADVFCKQDNEQVAQWRGHVSPHAFAYILNDLGRYYNDALCGPEDNNMGGTTILVMVETLQYYNMFYREQPGVDGQPSTRRMGWHTSGPSKRSMVAELQRQIADWEETGFRLHSETTVKECMTFIADHTKEGQDRYAAQAGCNDDTVITACINLMLQRSSQSFDRPTTDRESAGTDKALKTAGIRVSKEPASRYDRAVKRARQEAREWGRA